MVSKLSRYLSCLIALLVLGGAVECRAQNVWTKLAPRWVSPPTYELGVQFASDSSIYALGYSDSTSDLVYHPTQLLKTTDAGRSWKLIYKDAPTNFIYGLRFSSFSMLRETSFVRYGYSTLSADGSGYGQPYSDFGSLSSSDLYAEFILSCHSADGFDFVIEHPYDMHVASDFAAKLYRVSKTGSVQESFGGFDSSGFRCFGLSASFRNRKVGLLAVSDSGFFSPPPIHEALRTTDGGSSWHTAKLIRSDSNPFWYSVQFFPGHGSDWVALCTFGKVSGWPLVTLLERSNDNGLTWSVDSLAPSPVKSVAVSSDSIFYCVKEGSPVLYRDGGSGLPWKKVLFNLPNPDLLYIGDSIIYVGANYSDIFQSNLAHPQNSAGLEISTKALYLGSIPLGGTRCSTVVLRSVGALPLKVMIDPQHDTSLVVDLYGEKLIVPGDSLVLTICCTGRSEAQRSRLLHVSNNAGSLDTTIEIYWNVPVGRVDRTPSPIDLGDVLVGDTVRARLTLRSTGDVPLRIDSAQFLDSEISGVVGPVTISFEATLRPKIFARTRGISRATLVLYSNDPSFPRDTISWSFRGLDSSTHLAWVSALNTLQDSADQYPQEVVCDGAGGVFCTGLGQRVPSFAEHSDSSGFENWREQAKRPIHIALTNEHDLIVVRSDDSLRVKRLSKDLKQVLWQVVDSVTSCYQTHLIVTRSGKVELSTGCQDGRPLGVQYQDAGNIRFGELSSTGEWVYRFIKAGSAVENVHGGRLYLNADYPTAIALDSSERRYDMYFLSDSLNENRPITAWFYHAFAGPYLRYNYNRGGTLETDRFGHLLILFDDELLMVDTIGRVLRQTTTVGMNMAVDAVGNVYLLDKSDLGITKLDSNLQFVWQHSYLGDDDAPGISSAIALDRWGNVYATGTSIGQDGSADAVTMKYSSDGNRRWIAKYAGLPGTPDSGSKIAVDAQGEVFVLASTTTPKGHNGLTLLKYFPPQDSFANSVAPMAKVEAASLQIFANPAKDQITIAYHPQSLSGERGIELVVTDVTGREVVKKMLIKSGEERTLSTKDLSNGLYFVRVMGAGLQAKFVIAR